MFRYKVIKKLYPILRFLAICYFWIVNAVFDLYNFFLPSNHVEWDDNISHLNFLPVTEAAKQIRSGKLSVKELVTAYISRIKDVNPRINAVVNECFELALQEAAETDAVLAEMSAEERVKLAKSKPLFGIPFTAKDNIRVKGLVSVAGNKDLLKAQQVSEVDAEVMKRVREAGGILLGLTNMPNRGLSWTTSCSAHGMSNNPHDFRRMTGGGSGGEGAIAAVGGSAFGIGNDIAGSVRIPAFMNGVYGLKPTSQPGHLIPNDGIVPEEFFNLKNAKQQQQLANGPICRYAEDLPLLLSVMSGKELSNFELEIDFSKQLNLFYMEEWSILPCEGVHTEIKNAIQKTKHFFELKHNLNVQKVDFPLMSHLYELWAPLGFGTKARPLSKLLPQFWKICSGAVDSTLLAWEFAVLHNFVEPRNEGELKFVLEKREKLRQQLIELLGSDGVLMLPTWPTTTPYHHMEAFIPFNCSYTQMFNVLGFPALTVPIGEKSPRTNTPLGIQLAAAPWNEALLIAVAKEMEKGMGGWMSPAGKRKHSNSLVYNNEYSDEFRDAIFAENNNVNC